MKEIKVRLTRLVAGEQSQLRTDSVEGYTYFLPTAGLPFTLTGKPLTAGTDVRVVQTSRIQKVETLEGFIHFQTESGSRYELEVLDG